MSEVSLFPTVDVRRQPWPAGGGVARELVRWPSDPEQGEQAEGGDFDLRIALVELEAPGPLAALLGYERLWTVTEGEGLLLEHADAARGRARRLEAYRFSGDRPTTVEPIAGPVPFLEVLERRGGARAEVQAVRLGARRMRESLRSDQLFALALAGPVLVRLTGEEEAFELGSGDALWARGLERNDELNLEGAAPACEILLVGITLLLAP